jgi:hypothetical protein
MMIMLVKMHPHIPHFSGQAQVGKLCRRVVEMQPRGGGRGRWTRVGILLVELFRCPSRWSWARRSGARARRRIRGSISFLEAQKPPNDRLTPVENHAADDGSRRRESGTVPLGQMPFGNA